MKRQIKERDQLLKNKEEELKIILQKKGKQLKNKASRIGTIALLSGFISLIIYSVYRSLSDKKSKVKKIKKNNSSLTTKLSKVITPYAIKLISDYLNTKKNK